MADEDLYKQTLKLADADYAKQQPFLLQLMTTSNHRPYTYPDERIDIKSGNGRDGAVKYTDYAIGQFLDAGASESHGSIIRSSSSSPTIPPAVQARKTCPSPTIRFHCSSMRRS